MENKEHPIGIVWYTSYHSMHTAEYGKMTVRTAYSVDENGLISSWAIPYNTAAAPNAEVYSKVTKKMKDYCKELGYTKFRSGISNCLRRSHTWKEFVSLIQKGAQLQASEIQRQKIYDLAKACPHIGEYLICLEDKETVIHDDGFDLYILLKAKSQSEL